MAPHATRDAANRPADALSNLRARNALVRDRAGEREARSFHLRMQHLRTLRSQGCAGDAALVGSLWEPLSHLSPWQDSGHTLLRATR